METSPLQVDIALQTNHAKQLVVTLSIFNRSGLDLCDWNFHLDLPKAISPGNNTQLIHRAGSHISLALGHAAVLRNNERCELQFVGERTIIRRLSDLPNGMYVQTAEHCLPASLGRHNLAQLNDPDSQAKDDLHTTPSGSSPKGNCCTTAGRGVIDSQAYTAVPLIPQPAEAVSLSGTFRWQGQLCTNREPLSSDAIHWLSTLLPNRIADELKCSECAQIRFLKSDAVDAEGYQLEVLETHIEIRASDSAGFFHAATSLAQLLVSTPESDVELQQVIIKDTPRFSYRGLMLDCARHFHSPAVIIKLLDLMALYKLNYFHWHLTDDEAWRIEIRAFPELTDIGAWRGAQEPLEPQLGSGPQRYGGYYTQADINSVVAHAQTRGITVIPEIDVPGHSRAAVKSLPHMLVEEQDRSAYCSVQYYTDNVLNPALPGTYDFLHKVLDEVCELFPGPYVHLGADEIPDGVWEDSPACQALMREHGYTQTLELQGHFLRRLQSYLGQKDKIALGWEEAARSKKLDPSAIVFAWSGVASSIESAQLGHRVVACPAPFTYLDMAWDDSIEEPGFHWAGTADLETCYAYEPLCIDGEGDLSAQLIGVQSLLWSELIASPERLDYMLIPRMLAIAEVAWSPRCSKRWQDFQSRVDHHKQILDQMEWRVHTAIASAEVHHATTS